MKTAIALIVLMTGSVVAFNYGSKYLMGGIESGLPGGGNGKFADYHEDNYFAYWLSDYDEEYKPSAAALNPFAENEASSAAEMSSSVEVVENPFAE